MGKGWLLGLLFFLSFQISLSQDRARGTLLYMDGKNITHRARFELKKDDLIRFDAYGLLAGSSITLEARKKGGRFFNESFAANQRGEMKTILFFPKVKGAIKCTASYTSKNGKNRKIVFFLDPVSVGSPLKTFPRGTGRSGGG